MFSRLVLSTVLVLSLASALAHAAEDKVEMRGVWIKDYGSPEETDRLLDKAEQAGLNTLYARVWYDEPRYPSRRFPGGPEVGEFDPVRYLLDEAKQRGFQIHAWFINGKRWGSKVGEVPEAWYLRNPEGEKGKFLDWSNPRFRDYQKQIMLEFLEMYPDIDGLHFDYIRYAQRGMYHFSESSRRGFQQVAGVDPLDLVKRPNQFSPQRLKELEAAWLQWRKDQVTKAVAEISAEARRMKPDILMTAAVRNFQSGIDAAGQDWPRWIEQGYLDYAVPMYYENNPETYARLLEWYATIGEKPFKRVIPSVGAYIGESMNEGESGFADVQKALKVYHLGQEAGAQGVVFFYLHGMPDDYVEAFGEGPFSEPARPYTPDEYARQAAAHR